MKEVLYRLLDLVFDFGLPWMLLLTLAFSFGMFIGLVVGLTQ